MDILKNLDNILCTMAVGKLLPDVISAKARLLRDRDKKKKRRKRKRLVRYDARWRHALVTSVEHAAAGAVFYMQTCGCCCCFLFPCFFYDVTTCLLSRGCCLVVDVSGVPGDYLLPDFSFSSFYSYSIFYAIFHHSIHLGCSPLKCMVWKYSILELFCQNAILSCAI